MRLFIAAVCVGAAALTLRFILAYRITEWSGVVLLVCLVLVTENMAFHLPVTGSVSLSFAAAYAALLHSGPLAAIVVAIAASTNLAEIRSGKPLAIHLFNAGQLVVSVGLAAIVYIGLGGMALADGPVALADILVPAVLAAAAFYVGNVALVSMGASLLMRKRLTETVGSMGFLSFGSSLLVLALLGLLVAYLLAVQSWLGLLLLVLPFMVARRTFRVYVELTEAYTSTVRSLVTAIEAKDPYTRGHSERVAEYARMLAERIGMPRTEIDLIERAALLHDVGKIGISLDTLVSPEKLTPDEVNAIRQHPALGSDLVSDVEFLSDIVDIVRHHHERCDGTGYPDGLVGERISVPARILAVADAYDAMTSDRAYRPRMTDKQAREELQRVADSQLDGEIVRQFTDMLSEARAGGASA
ncbi:HD-GYP domain-containing protein [Anaerosoma tenue]|uniref:HD-GYP domain-containing protein n=1 Tax=Anaerosoma tenue TaxID=2933588 RepID=UPI0022609DFE|nr:HD-GYP domain-containing protein [Anaerosoma tenue]MCK8114570.1 HD-GYP domain-containing protein [Anaerosoma tenue]